MTGAFLSFQPVQIGVVNLAVPDRRELEPDQTPGMLTPLLDLIERSNPCPRHGPIMTGHARPLPGDEEARARCVPDRKVKPG
jgi:hypothetical protein